MNPSVNRLSESSPSSGEQSPEPSNQSRMNQGTPKDNLEPEKLSTTDSQLHTGNKQLNANDKSRQHPIPPPSDPKQFRAIGLVLGRYQPSTEQLTRGTLLTQDGVELEAVLLGRLISLVKNHLDLEENHLWVVYPRTRQEESNLHVQLVGVWAPEMLAQEAPEDDETNSSEPEEPEKPVAIAPQKPPSQSPPPVKDGYFSIRGEVVFYSQEQEKVVVKIHQAARKGDERARFFKLELKGHLSADRPIHRFWDLQVFLQGNTLQIEKATDIGPLPIKKRKKTSGGKGNYKRNFDRRRNAKSGPRSGPRRDRHPVGKPKINKEGSSKPVQRPQKKTKSSDEQ